MEPNGSARPKLFVAGTFRQERASFLQSEGREIGRDIAKAGFDLVCGPGTGLARHVIDGYRATRGHGDVIGVLPRQDVMARAGEVVGEGLDQRIETPLDYPTRNIYHVSLCQGVIAYAGGPGTLQEMIAGLNDYLVPVVAVRGQGSAVDAIEMLANGPFPAWKSRLRIVDRAVDAVPTLLSLIATPEVTRPEREVDTDLATIQQPRALAEVYEMYLDAELQLYELGVDVLPPGTSPEQEMRALEMVSDMVSEHGSTDATEVTPDAIADRMVERLKARYTGEMKHRRQQRDAPASVRERLESTLRERDDFLSGLSNGGSVSAALANPEWVALMSRVGSAVKNRGWNGMSFDSAMLITRAAMRVMPNFVRPETTAWDPVLARITAPLPEDRKEVALEMVSRMFQKSPISPYGESLAAPVIDVEPLARDHADVLKYFKSGRLKTGYGSKRVGYLSRSQRDARDSGIRVCLADPRWVACMREVGTLLRERGWNAMSYDDALRTAAQALGVKVDFPAPNEARQPRQQRTTSPTARVRDHHVAQVAETAPRARVME